MSLGMGVDLGQGNVILDGVCVLTGLGSVPIFDFSSDEQTQNY